MHCQQRLEAPFGASSTRNVRLPRTAPAWRLALPEQPRRPALCPRPGPTTGLRAAESASLHTGVRAVAMGQTGMAQPEEAEEGRVQAGLEICKLRSARPSGGRRHSTNRPLSPRDRTRRRVAREGEVKQSGDIISSSKNTQTKSSRKPNQQPQTPEPRPHKRADRPEAAASPA